MPDLDDLDAKLEKAKEKLIDRADQILEAAKRRTAFEDEMIEYVKGLDDEISARHLSKMFEWLSRSAGYRAVALKLLQEGHGGPATVAEAVAIASLDAAKAGLE